MENNKFSLKINPKTENGSNIQASPIWICACKCMGYNKMCLPKCDVYSSLFSALYIEYILNLKPYQANLNLNIQNKVLLKAYFLFIAGNVPDRSVFTKKCLTDQLFDKCACKLSLRITRIVEVWPYLIKITVFSQRKWQGGLDIKICWSQHFWHFHWCWYLSACFPQCVMSQLVSWCRHTGDCFDSVINEL